VGATHLEDHVTEPLTRDRLAEIAARLQAAAKGPWTVEAHQPTLTRRVVSYDGMLDANLGYLGNCNQADAAFIANAPDDIQWLLDRVRELEATVAELTAENGTYERALGLNEATA
jgi:hypothetical protein